MLKTETRTKLLLMCGAIGCPLFVLVFLIEGTARAGYDPVLHPISSLSIGEFGWIQVTNFIITGLLLFAFAIGLKFKLAVFTGRSWEPLLIQLAAIGLIGSGIFSTDPVFGYPEDKPFITEQFSIHGNLHILFSLLVFFCLPAACFLFRKRFVEAGQYRWAAYSRLTGITMIVTFAIAGIGFMQILWFADFGGVFQRISIIAGWAWLTLIALHLMKPGYTILPK